MIHRNKLGQVVINDLSGKTFGELTVIERSMNVNGRPSFKCRCSCGNEKIVMSQSLKSGTVKSCGCLSKRYGKDNIFWKGYGEISLSFFSIIKKGAESRNLEFNISIEEIWSLFLFQKKKCALSGMDLRFQSKNSIRDGTASLDRIDSSRGYVIDNIQWVHKDINWLKNDWSQKEFIELCSRVANHNHS